MTHALSKSFALVVIASLPLVAHSATLRVPQQYASIQAAIDAARNGDVVRVAAGTYGENLIIESKWLSLIGAGADTTALDGGALDRVIMVQGAPAGGVTIAGFTIRNGLADGTITPFLGGGLWALDSNLLVRDNVFTGNSACIGMALTVQGGSINLLRNRVVANTHPNGCGAEAVALLVARDSTVEQNVIADNPAAGVFIDTDAKVFVRHNVIRNNAEDPLISARGWGGLGSYVTQLVLENNLFEHNTGAVMGGAFLGDAENGTVSARNNSFVGNNGPYASAIMLSPVFQTGFDIASNLLADDNGIAEIDCGGIPIGKNNVFGSSTTPALAPGCSFAP